MTIHVEATIPADMAEDFERLSAHFFPDHFYRRSRYILKAVQEKINRDKARLERAAK